MALDILRNATGIMTMAEAVAQAKDLKATYSKPRPMVGDRIKVYGGTHKATIMKVWPFGTVDAKVDGGGYTRITGLGFR